MEIDITKGQEYTIFIFKLTLLGRYAMNKKRAILKLFFVTIF